MTIEIEEGRLDQIVVHENESAMYLAKTFCQKHGLHKKLQGALAARIERNIDDVISQEEAPQFEVEDSQYEPPRASGPDYRSYIEEYSKVMLEKKNETSIVDRALTRSQLSNKPAQRATTVTPSSFKSRSLHPRTKSPKRTKSPVQAFITSQGKGQPIQAQGPAPPIKNQHPQSFRPDIDETAVFQEIEQQVQQNVEK